MYPEVLTLEEVAEILKVTVQTVKRYINRKENPLPVVKLTHRLYRVPKVQFLEWLKSQSDPRLDV